MTVITNNDFFKDYVKQMKKYLTQIHFRPEVYFRLSILWVALISLLSSVPNLHVKKVVPQSDKYVHVVIFSVLAYLLFGALRNKLSRLQPVIQIAFIVVICAAAGFLDEAHQLLVAGRTFSLWDWAADILGCTLGAMAYYLFHKN